ncbi:xanthine dehydrogenase family protein subunit M [Puniceibacterium sp. IMCC21224]|uniref:FAD binding domain-containing protein n=1 Tax=Puniceibacterium sp. IMCC21224 TaxID=1618204 RepID=UPI00064D9227|nr:xanthine dehydrogenase family protein subunit M [Puniceibacterium sp. IMCC21224]KMK66135.1 aerobic-type carbon monoxide dehydrogenase, middle subunit CoxM/CutM-like protein [Puniceibacterium sp. IMCC21224]
MKAQAGGYVRATDVSHALRMLAEADGAGRVLAGGQSLIAAMNMRLSTGDMLVDISRLAELSGVTDDGDCLRIGALTRHVDIGRDPLIRRFAPLLSEAVDHIAHAAIRNRGTIGGALAHADPAAEFPAAILCLDATLHIQGPDGTRSVAAGDFFVDVFTTDLQEGEILIAITLRKCAQGEHQVLEEVARRSGDYALAGLCLIRRSSGHRVALLSVGATPVLATGAMAALDTGTVDEAVAALKTEIDPPSDTQASASYRKHLAGVLLRRAVARIEGGQP